jgi:hypothetical protein
MPLERSARRAAVGRNIRREIAAGKPREQAVAIAVDIQRREAKRSGLSLREQGGRRGTEDE